MANTKSFERGVEYYRSSTIFNTSRRGNILLGDCAGSSAPYYHLRVEVEGNYIKSAVCSCPYDLDGYCKHIVALLLTYIHQPDKFVEQKSVIDLLQDLEKDALVALIARLVERDQDLYNKVEMAIPMVKVTTQPESAVPRVKQQTQVSEPTYRKQVRRILKQSRYDENYDNEWDSPAYLDDLEEVLQTANQFLAAGDAEGALVILRVLLEETTNDYDSDVDYNGDVASFIQDLGMPMAEAILSVEMDDKFREELETSIREILDNLDEAIEESELEVVGAAIEYGWSELPDEETQWDEFDEEEWMLFDTLQQARLNVLEYQGRSDEFLKLAQKGDTKRYVLKLLELKRVDEAVAASQSLSGNHEILAVAQKMQEAGRLGDAITLAERGLNQAGYFIYELATWLAPLEESLGKKELAVVAYKTAFDVHPTIENYRHIKQLCGANWNNLREELMLKVPETQMPEIMVEIHLEEHNWDAAITLAEKHNFYYDLIAKVADAVIQYRPDWVIRVSIKQSDALIVKTQSNLYPTAAQWLRRAKQAYLHKGQIAEWQAYITNLRATYARRPAFQKAIANL
jgi:uncharacterized Zn finger protein